MASALKSVVRRLRRAAGFPKICDCNDRQLLERFAESGEQEAFAALVQRHGSLVLGVCRRVLHNAEDAEDAFQATFLVLARKAHSSGWHNSISNWLYGVAYRVALKTRTRRSRQRNRELEYRPDTPTQSSPGEQITWGEMRCLLDAELQGLPARYRAPLLLCYLEGKTRDEAAQQLGWSPGSVKGRLERGRELLRQRLARRGLTISAVLCASLLPESAQAAVPATLTANTLQVAAGPSAGLISPQVLTLAQGVMKAMFIAKMKVVGALMVAASLFALGAVAANSAFFADEDGRERGVRGIVKSVDPQKGTISVQTFAGERPADQATTYNLANKDVKVTVNERAAAKLTDLVEGTRVLLRLSGDDDVLAINAFSPSMRVRVKSLDMANKTITIITGERGETRELKLAADARVPEKIDAETPAEVVLSLDRTTVLALNASRRDGEGPREEGGRRIGAGVRGVALSVDAKKGTIEILTGGEGNPKITTYPVTSETQFFLNEREASELKLETIPRAARVTFRLTDDGKVSHLSVLQPMVGGVIGEIDAKAGTLSLRAEGGLQTLKLAPAATVFGGEQKMALTDLKSGMRVMLQLSLDGNQVQTIRYFTGEGERRPAPREGEPRKDGERRDPPRREGDVPRESERRPDAPRGEPVRRDGQPREE